MTPFDGRDPAEDAPPAPAGQTSTADAAAAALFPSSDLARSLAGVIARLPGAAPRAGDRLRLIEELADVYGWGEATRAALLWRHLDWAAVHAHLARELGWDAGDVARLTHAQLFGLLRRLAPPEGAEGASASDAPPPPEASPPPLVLGAVGDEPVVLGQRLPPLSAYRHAILKAVLDAGPTGLNKTQLDLRTGYGDARKALKRLAGSDPRWAAVIHFPGKKGGGSYRIGPPSPPPSGPP